MCCIALSGHDDDVRIFWIDDHLIDLGRLFQADMNKCLARIGGLVHSITGRSLYGITRSDINDVRIGRSDLDRSDAIDILELVEYLEPGCAATRGLP